MPLNQTALTQALAQVFAHAPKTHAACAQKWADAVRAYAAGVVPPSTTVTAAAGPLASALATAFAAKDAIPGMESAFAAFAVAVGGGMVGYTPVPPAGAVGFQALFAGPKPKTHAAAAAQIASRIQAWMTTGISTLIAPPNTALPWS